MKKRQKGFAIIWSVLAGGVMLTLATVMVNSVIRESKMVINFAASTQASSAARSGITWATWCINNQESCGYDYEGGEVRSYLINANDPAYVAISIRKVIEGTQNVYYVDSTGTKDKAIRKLNFRYAPKDAKIAYIDTGGLVKNVKINNLLPTFPNSFVFSFDNWSNSDCPQVSASGVGRDMKVDFGVSTGSTIIRLRYYRIGTPTPSTCGTAIGEWRLEQVIPANNQVLQSRTIKLVDPVSGARINYTKPYAINITVKYVKYVNATLIVKIRDINGNLPEVTYRETMGMPAVDMGQILTITFPHNTTRPESDIKYEWNNADYYDKPTIGADKFYFANLEVWGNPINLM